MKKIAICISGHLRTYKKTFTCFVENLYKPLKSLGDINIFLFTNKTISTNTGWQGGIGKNQDESEIDVEEAIKSYGATAFVEDFELVKDQFQTSNFISPVPEIVDIRRHSSGMLRYIPMFAKIFNCNELKCQKEKSENFKYDLVVRTRPDLLYPHPIDIKRVINIADDKNIFIGGKTWITKDAHFKYENGGQCQDLFAIGTSESMDIYCSLYKNLKELFKNNLYSEVAENILWNHLKIANNFNIHSIYNEIPILR